MWINLKKFRNFVIDEVVLKKPMLTVIIVTLLVIVLIGLQIERLQSNVMNNQAIHNAKQLNDTLARIRRVYSSDVVSRITDIGGIVTHDFEDHAGAIPLPATFTMAIGNQIDTNVDSMKSRLYSPFPFPNRLETGGLRDGFDQAAWNALIADTQTPFYRFEVLNSQPVLRYATADVMQSSCVACHNNHPATPKSDWKVGDLRGILEVTVPMSEPIAYGNKVVGEISKFILILSISFILALSWVIRRLNTEHKLAQRLATDSKNANKIKSEFLASMSHELRTPLNAIIGFAEALEMGICADDKDERNERLKIIANSGRQLNNLISDILDFSKIEAGKLKFNIKAVLPSDVFESCLPTIRQLTEGNNISFEGIKQSNVKILVDPARLQQIIINFISNAVKYNRPNGSIEFGCHETSDNLLRIYVKDTGMGIPKEKEELLFSHFDRIDQSNSDIEGFGLGLAICKKLTESMNGTIGYETTLGKGSTFWIEFPVESHL